MPEKKQIKKKVVIIQLDQPEGLRAIDDDDNKKTEIEIWPHDGKDNVIPVGTPVQVSPELALRLIRAGRISKATIQTITVDL